MLFNSRVRKTLSRVNSVIVISTLLWGTFPFGLFQPALVVAQDEVVSEIESPSQNPEGETGASPVGEESSPLEMSELKNAENPEDRSLGIELQNSVAPTPLWPTVWSTPGTCYADGNDESPDEVDIVGDPAVYYASDGNFVYFRMLLEGNPLSPSAQQGFSNAYWGVLLDKDNNGYYDFVSYVNGHAETVEIWKNTSQTELLSWNPVFHDAPEVQVYSVPVMPTSATSSVSGSGYQIMWSLPISVGDFVFNAASDRLYFYTSENSNNINKDFLNCYGAPIPSDRDLDGVPDDTDNCPDVANPNQEDVDGDGYGDVCDNCPLVANADQSDSNNNGVGDACDVPPSVCGNGIKEGREQCDDGNQSEGDYCSNNCTWNFVCAPQSNLVQNGGFELPVVATPQKWDVYPQATPYLGWDVSWMGVYDGQPIPQVEIHRGVNGWVSQEGLQYAELDSDWDGPAGSLNGEPASVSVFQTIPTMLGYEYEVRFWFSPRPGTPIGDNQLQFMLNGVPVTTMTGVGGGNTVWSEYVGTFTAMTNGTEIRFNDLGAPNSFGTFLDNVQVTCLGPTKGSVSGAKWNDVNGNGIWENQELGLGGWEIQLKNPTGAPVSVITDQNGNFSFDDVVPGNYEVCEVNQVGWNQTSPDPFDGGCHSVVVSPSQEVTDVNFGNQKVHATIMAYKVVCDNEMYLPNWGTGANGAPKMITATTAEDYVKAHSDHCYLESGWDFQWGYEGEAIKPSTGALVGPADTSGWKSFDTSTSVDPASVYVYDLKPRNNIYVRENLKEGYFPYSYPPAASPGRDVSAEIYCHTDVEKYDNYDRIDAPQNGQTYYCVAFNALEASTVEVCKLSEASGAGLPGWEVALASELVAGPHAINVSNGNGTDTADLPAGKYLVMVSGTYRYGSTAMIADAGFSYRPTGIPAGCNCWLSGFDLPSGSNGLMAWVNGNPVNWGMYNDAHSYSAVIDHPGGALKVSLYDDVYGDNVNNGNFQFSVYKIDSSMQGTTGSNGCVTFTGVPFGEYYLDEVLPYGWLNLPSFSDEGMVTVDGLTERFELVNRQVMGAVKVTKDIEWNQANPDESQKFEVCLQGPSLSDGDCKMLGDGESFSWGALIPGDYSVIETDPGASWLVSGSGDTVTVPTVMTSSLERTVEHTVTNTLQHGSIVVHKFIDLNQDGVQDDGDVNKSGWTMQLFGGSDCDDATLIKDEVTNEDGYALFSSLTPGSYSIREEERPGWAHSGELCRNVELTANEEEHVWYGNFEWGTIRGRKFNDLNANGSKDSVEPWIEKWEITLYDSDWSEFGSMETGVNGLYEFSTLPLGTYFVCELSKVDDNWKQTLPSGTGGVANHSGNIDEASRCRRAVIDESGDDIAGLHFGNVKLGSISGSKFEDLNGDGMRMGMGISKTEPGLQGWIIELKDNIENVIDTTVTDSKGDYEFMGLIPGMYRVCEVPQKGWHQTSSPTCHDVTVSGDNHTKKDFGNFQLATLTGRKCDDPNGDGNVLPGHTIPLRDNEIGAEFLRGGDCQPMGGWTIKLYRDDGDGIYGDGDNYVDETVTRDSDGKYFFYGLEPGLYFVKEVLPKDGGWEQTRPLMAFGRDYHRLLVDDSGKTYYRHFANFKPGEIHGYKWDDSDGDGMWDQGEKALSDWTIRLCKTDGAFIPDLSSMPSLTGLSEVPSRTCPGGVWMTTTNEDGAYYFTSLPAGQYRISEVRQDGYRQTYPTSPRYYEVSVMSQTVIGSEACYGYPMDSERAELEMTNGMFCPNFGNYEFGSISGLKFEDYDGDGTWDDGMESPLQDWTMRLYRIRPNGVWVNTTREAITDENGVYAFNRLNPGNYAVCEVLPSTWTQTYPHSMPSALTTTLLTGVVGNNSGASDEGEMCYRVMVNTEQKHYSELIFGNYENTPLEVYKYEDLNANGMRDDGEPMLSGWDMILTSIERGMPVPVDSTLTSSVSDWNHYDVPATGATVDLGVIPAGAYLNVIIEGTASAGDGITFDAECSSRNGSDWKNYVRNYESYGERLLDVEINGMPTEWGLCNPNHAYSKLVKGDGSAVSLNVYDIYYPNNEGSFQVRTMLITPDTVVETDETGKADFGNMEPGRYMVCEVEQLGWVQTQPSTGTMLNGLREPAVNLAVREHVEGSCYSFSVFSGEAKSLYFGNFEFGTLGGYKYDDDNGDGEWDEGETGIGNWGMTLYTSDWKELDTKVTDSSDSDDNGHYIFNGLHPDSYYVCEEDKTNDGWVQTEPRLYEYEEDDERLRVLMPSEDSTVLHNGLVCYRVTVEGSGFGSDSEWNFGNYGNPIQTIAKTNDALDEKLPGESVQYTLVVKVLNNELEDVILYDVLPKGFAYVPGSWTVLSSFGTKTKLLESTTVVPEPMYDTNGIGSWLLGNFEEGEVVTLTYLAKISEDQDGGVYPDIAMAWGENKRGEQVNAVDEDNLEDPTDTFVGTEVAVASPVLAEEAGVVLGTQSVRLSQTGQNILLYLVGALVSLLGLGTLFFLTKGKSRKLVLGIAVTSILSLGLVGIVPSVFAADNAISVEIQSPDPSTNESSFPITFVALDREARGIDWKCYYAKGDVTPAIEFDSGTLSGYGGSARCEVDNSVITSEGLYSFAVTVDDSSDDASQDPVMSERVLVTYDASRPGAVLNYSREKVGDCSYKIAFKTADDGQTKRYEIYRSTSVVFEANSSTLVVTDTVAPNASVTYTDTITSCSPTTAYYYVVRAVDESGNTSPFTGDVIVNTEFIITPAPGGGGAGGGAAEGEVEGAETGEDGQNGESDEDGDVLGEDEEDIDEEDENGNGIPDDEEESSEDSEGINWGTVIKVGAVILGLGALLAAFLSYRGRKSV